MNNKKTYIYILAMLAALTAVFVFVKIFIMKEKVPAVSQSSSSKDSKSAKSSKNDSSQPAIPDNRQYASDISLAGPGANVPDGAPGKDDFKLFSIPVPEVLSRSNQPSLEAFKWLKDNGWKSVVDFREDGEKGNPYALDSKLPGFNELGLNFLSLAIKDGSTPSADQADQFLKFVIDPKNQPVHIHCAAGIGRTGIGVALYRYSVQSWPMDKAIEEAGLFNKSISKSQQSWLNKWAASHEPGSYKP